MVLKIRAKTVVIFLITTVLLVAALHELTFAIVSNSFGQLERKEVAQEVEQIHGAMLNKYSNLNSKLSDWSQWNDTYAFVQNNNSAYIADNLVPTSLYPFGLNFLLFVNSTGSLVYGLGLDLANGTATKVPVPQSLSSLIASDTRMWKFSDTKSNFTGMAVLPEGPLIFASQPILTSDGQGPIHGAAIFARYLNGDFVKGLSQTLSLPLSSSSYGAWQESGVSTSAYLPPSTYIHIINSDEIAGYYVLNDINGKPGFVIGTTLPRNTYKQGLATVNYVDVIVGAAGVVFSAATMLLMEGAMLSRLQKLASEVSTIGGKKNLSARVSISGDDEIATLGGSINNMLGEMEKMTLQLRRSERFSAIGELATMVAHDLRNPLQGIANAAFFLKQNPTGVRTTEMLSLIQRDVKYSDKIVRDLLDYSRDLRLEVNATTPKELVKGALSMIPIPENVQVKDETADLPPLNVDVEKITRTFANIISNAVEAMRDGGTLKIKTHHEDHDLRFTFADTGVGMTKEVLEKIYTPLYTTKAKGMGFGLAISKRMIEAHGGWISAESVPGRGTTFIISIPLVPLPREVKS